MSKKNFSRAKSDKRYAAADVKNIVGMDRNTLFYCVKTLGLVQPSQELDKVTLYDFGNLLDLALIQELLKLGITQGAIKKILCEPITPEGRFNVFYMGQTKEAEDIWAGFITNREEYERDGCVLLVQKEEGGYGFSLLSMRAAFDHMKMFWLPTVDFITDAPFSTKKTTTVARPFGHVIIIDILGLVSNIEAQTGERLDYYGWERMGK